MLPYFLLLTLIVILWLIIEKPLVFGSYITSDRALCYRKVLLSKKFFFAFFLYDITLNKALCDRKEAQRKQLFCITSLILFIVFAGLRAPYIGADTTVYINAIGDYSHYSLFYLLKNGLSPYDFEPGYVVLTKIASILRMNYTAFFFLIACIIYFPVFQFVYKNSSSTLVSLFLFVTYANFLYTLGIFRQAIAVSICMFSTNYIAKRKPLPFLGCMLAAVLFHTTAICFIGIYPINVLFRRIEWRKIILIIAFVLEAIMLFAGRYIVKLIPLVFPSYAGYVDSIYGEATSGYLNLLLLNIILSACIVCLKCGKEEDQNFNLMIVVLLFAVVVQSLSYFLAIIGRVVWFFSIYLIALIPNAINKLFCKRLAIAIDILLMFMLLFYFYNTLSLDDNSLVPYFFFWQA